MMNIEIIQNINWLMTYRDEWNSILAENSNNNPFITPDWIKHWWNYFGSGKELYVIRVYDDSMTIGIFPLMLKEKMGFTYFNFVGYRQSSRMDFIVRHGYESRFIDLITAHMLHVKGRAVYCLHGLNREDYCYKLIMKKLSKNTYFKKEIINHIINLYAFERDEYFSSRKSHCTIKQTLRREKKLLGISALQIVRANENDIDIIFPLHQKRWSRKNDGNGFGRGKLKCFFEFLAKQKETSDFKVSVFLLKAGDLPIAFTYLIECNNRAVFYRLAHDDDFSIFKPGMIAIKQTIEECFSGKMSIFDFSTGDEQYKSFWADDYEFMEEVTFGTDSTSVGLIILLKRIKHSFRMLLKKSNILVRFKRDTIGKIKYYLSLYPALSFMKILCNRVSRKGLLRYIVDSFGVKAVCLSRNGYKTNPLISLKKVASLDDLPLVTEICALHPQKIVHRYHKGSRLNIILLNGNPAGYVWVSEKK